MTQALRRHLLLFFCGAWLLFVALLAPRRAHAQVPPWQAALSVNSSTSGSTSGVASVRGSAADANGNVWLVGYYEGTVTIGSTTLSNNGNHNVFVAKWNTPTGRFVWALQGGGRGNDYGTAIAVSGSNVYITGTYQQYAATFGAATLANAGQDDVFVAKIADNGTTAGFVWAERVSGSAREQAEVLAADGPNVYVGGSFASPSADFGSSTHYNSTFAGSSDLFVAKLTDQGNTGGFAWVKLAGNTRSEYVTGLAVSGTSVYVSGYHNSTSLVLGSTTLVNASSGNNDAFLTKLTDQGSSSSFVWALRAGGTGDNLARALTVQGNKVYLAGGYSGSVSFGPVTLSPVDGTAFVAKLTDQGSTVGHDWALAGGGNGGYQTALSIAASGSSVYVAGVYSGWAVFGSNTLYNFDTDNSTDQFVAYIADAGSSASYRWGRRLGNTGNDYYLNVAVGGPNVYVSGSSGHLFGSTPVGGFLAYFAGTVQAVGAPGRTAALGVYPNPTRNAVTLRLSTDAPRQGLRLSVLDATGRPVLRKELANTGPELRVALGPQPAGLYLLRVEGPSGYLATQRLVVE